MSKPLVSSDILVKLIPIPPNTFQQHLPEIFFQHEVGKMEIDETLAQIKVQNLHNVGCTITKEKQLTMNNLGFEENLQ